MKSVSTATQAALQNAQDKGLVPRDFLWITARSRSGGAPLSRGFWSGDRTIETAVISGTTGAPETRTYIGGVNLDVGAIPRAADLKIETVAVKLSAIAPEVQEVLRGYDPRLAPVEIHSGLLDPDTRLLVDTPDIEFLGLVDGNPIPTAARGGEALTQLDIISEAIAMLTRTNPRKRSYEGQRRRQNDKFGKYSSTVREWRIYWGDRK